MSKTLCLTHVGREGGPESIGCPAGTEDDLSRCTNICVDDFAKPLRAIPDAVANVTPGWCLEAPAAAGSLTVEVTCEDCEPRTLEAGEFEVLDEPTCPGGKAVFLRDRPAAGTTVTITYRRAG